MKRKGALYVSHVDVSLPSMDTSRPQACSCSYTVHVGCVRPWHSTGLCRNRYHLSRIPVQACRIHVHIFRQVCSCSRRCILVFCTVLQQIRHIVSEGIVAELPWVCNTPKLCISRLESSTPSGVTTAGQFKGWRSNKELYSASPGSRVAYSNFKPINIFCNENGKN